MDTKSLETFLILAACKSFSKTADSLFVAQSTVTNRIAELEHEVGKKLFSRNKRKVALTLEGEAFLAYAGRIMEMSNNAISDINSLNRYTRLLRIGTTNTIYECHLFPYILNYKKNHPKDAVKITIGHSNHLIQGIQDNLYDEIYSYLPLYKTGYSCDLFASDDLILAAGSNHTKYENGIYKKDLENANYLFCNFALQEVGLFIRELFPPHFQFGFEIDNSTKLIPYLTELEGISFIPEKIAKPYLSSGQLKQISLLDFDAPKICCYKIMKSTSFVDSGIIEP